MSIALPAFTVDGPFSAAKFFKRLRALGMNPTVSDFAGKGKPHMSFDVLDAPSDNQERILTNVSRWALQDKDRKLQMAYCRRIWNKRPEGATMVALG